ncbi:MAG: hypothetical protein WBX20_19355, partial [Terrimicrobiaceae bacterium]
MRSSFCRSEAAARGPKRNFAGSPIVVPFAPQLELLRRAALTITHAGLNTALESLNQGGANGGDSHSKRSAGSREPVGVAGR